MRTPLLPTVLLAAALALSCAPCAQAAPGAPAEPKNAASKEAGADLEELRDALEARSSTRIDCKAGTTVTVPKDGKWVDATLVAVDLAAAQCAGKDGAEIKVPWFALGTGSAAGEILKKAVDPKEVGHHLLAARILANLKMGGAMADYHLKQAAALDKTAAAPKAKEALTLLAVADFNRTKPEWAWERLTPAKHAECLKAADDFVKTTAKKAGLSLCLAGETEHFSCYSDADPDVVRDWLKKSEAGHATLCRMFDLDPARNIFQGKCTAVLCRNRDNYGKWLGAAIPEDPSLAAAALPRHSPDMVHHGGGILHTVHDPARRAQIEHATGYEFAHAFTGIFHGTHRLPSWVNEGLAEHFASSGQGNEGMIQESRERLRATGSLETLYGAQEIQKNHRGAAFELTRLLLKKNPQGYGRFVKALTEGADQEEALKQNCGLTLEQLTALYAKSLGMHALRAK